MLKPDGTLWLNLGDSYVRGSGSRSKGTAQEQKGSSDGAVGPSDRPGGRAGGYAWLDGGAKSELVARRAGPVAGLAPKQLIGVPWRTAFALQSAGWWLREDLIWHKPNPMPESVFDRCTRAHEYVFHLAKSERYYHDAQAIAEPAANPKGYKYEGGYRDRLDHAVAEGRADAGSVNRIGSTRTATGSVPHLAAAHGDKRNRRSVWTITPKPFKGAHFATFPPALVEPCILAGSKIGDIVIDPFNGAATTGIVAVQHGRRYWGCELNPEYVEISRKRILGERERAI